MKTTKFTAVAGQIVLAAVATLGTTVASAQAPAVDHAAHPAPASAASQALPTQGEVRKVDISAGKLTLKHGPITHLDMPAMTMVFRVSDPALLAPLKQGDKVRFKADKVNGTYVVTAVEVAK